MTRLKGITAGMAMYAGDQEDWIVGSPSTSGSNLLVPVEQMTTMKQEYRPDPVQVWDWGGGMFRSLSMDANTAPHRDRFNEMRNMKPFTCPSNKFSADVYSGSVAWDCGRGPMISYNTSRNFMWIPSISLLASSFPNNLPYGSPTNPDSRWAQNGIATGWGSSWGETPTRDYVPRISKVGTPAGKVFIADGARYTELEANPQARGLKVDYDPFPYARWGGSFADSGPYSIFSRSWSLETANALNLGETRYTADARLYSFRHGIRESFQPVGGYRMNVGFFDTHVETMNDGDAANPHMWLPRGFALKDAGLDEYPQYVLDRYITPNLEDIPSLDGGQGVRIR
jgi:prepilin-type processing-associated H-X9-DG protein